jgi:excisionase family DNA binding protein
MSRTTSEVAEYFGTTERSVINWLRAGKLHGEQDGRIWRIDPASVERLRAEMGDRRPRRGRPRKIPAAPMVRKPTVVQDPELSARLGSIERKLDDQLRSLSERVARIEECIGEDEPKHADEPKRADEPPDEEDDRPISNQQAPLGREEREYLLRLPIDVWERESCIQLNKPNGEPWAVIVSLAWWNQYAREASSPFQAPQQRAEPEAEQTPRPTARGAEEEAWDGVRRMRERNNWLLHDTSG